MSHSFNVSYKQPLKYMVNHTKTRSTACEVSLLYIVLFCFEKPKSKVTNQSTMSTKRSHLVFDTLPFKLSPEKLKHDTLQHEIDMP